MNIVFDFGKVLFDWDPQALVARLLPSQVIDGDAEALAVRFFQHFDGDWADFDRGRLGAAPLAERIAQRTGIAVADARAVIDAVPHELRASSDMRTLLAELREAGHALWFLSNMPRPYADHLDAAHEFLATEFRGGLYSARVDLVKPEPAIFAHAVRQFGIDPAETLFIDDVEANVAAARAAGWQALRFENAAQCEAALRGLGLLRG